MGANSLLHAAALLLPAADAAGALPGVAAVFEQRVSEGLQSTLLV